METTQEMTFSLFRKWHAEGRIVQASLYCRGKTNCMVLGRIQHIDETKIKIDSRGVDDDQERDGLTIFVSEILGARYEDHRYIPSEFPEPARRAQFYDGFLFIDLIAGRCEVWAWKTPDELPELPIGSS